MRWWAAIPPYLRSDLAATIGFGLVFGLILIVTPPGPAILIVAALSVFGRLGAFFGIALRGQRWPIQRADWFAILVVISGVALVGGLIISLAAFILFRIPLRWPTPTDVMRPIVYPLIILAIFSLPTRSVPTPVRVRIVFDGLMILTAITSANWYFVTGPRIVDSRVPITTTLFASVLPLLDILALLSLILVARYFRDQRYRVVVLLFSLAILTFAITDSFYGVQLMSEIDAPSPWILFGGAVGWILAAVGARASRFVRPAEPRSSTGVDQRNSPPLLEMILPYGLVLLVGGFAFFVANLTSQSPLVVGVELGFGVVLLIVLIRQALVETENRRLDQDLIAANRRLAALSTTDPLTDLPNHRALVDLTDREIERARRFGRTLGLLFCDLDHFKQVNDTWGHAAGDAVLREFGELVRRRIRGNDVIGRWGGEEFLIVLPESGPESAGHLAERLRGAVCLHHFKGVSFQLTCSIGVAVYPNDATTSAELVDAADRAMYLAKKRGRDQIRFASDVEPRNVALAESESELPRS